MNIFGSWSYWAVGIGVGLPVCVILLTEIYHNLTRRRSYLARPAGLIRNYLLPLGALLLLLVKATEMPTQDPRVRAVATLFSFAVLLLLLSGLNVTLFQGAPAGSWRSRVPAIFIDVARFLLIGVGLALILSHIWGARIGGFFTALGVTSLVIGLMLQNSVGQIVSGLFMLLEQPFRIGDWLEVANIRGQVTEVNWRAVHIQTIHGLEIIPNAELAGTSFLNLSRPPGSHNLIVITAFAPGDPPDQVCAVLVRVAMALPRRRADSTPRALSLGGGEYRVDIGLDTPDDDAAVQATFLRWVWYAARRDGLRFNGAYDNFSTPARITAALRDVVAPVLRLTDTDIASLIARARMVRYGAGEVVTYAGQVPAAMTFLVAGVVQIVRTFEDGTMIPVTTLYPGSLVGASSLTRQPYTADVRVLTEVTAVELERDDVEELVMNRPAVLRDLSRIIDDRFSAAAEVRRHSASTDPG